MIDEALGIGRPRAAAGGERAAQEQAFHGLCHLGFHLVLPGLCRLMGSAAWDGLAATRLAQTAHPSRHYEYILKRGRKGRVLSCRAALTPRLGEAECGCFREAQRIGGSTAPAGRVLTDARGIAAR